MLHIPGGEHENGRVTPQRTCENFCPLYTEVHPIPLDGRDGGLRDASELRQLVLAQLLLSLDGPAEGTPEEIATAWDREIARRVEDMEAGRSPWIPADQVMTKIRARINDARNARRD